MTLRIERSLDAPRWLRVALPFLSLILAAILSGIVLELSGHDALGTYRQIYSASLTSTGGLTATFVYATPLLFTGLAVAIAFRMRVWNIGGEGQLYMGAIGASGVGLLLGGWSQPLVIVAMMVGGIVAGALWAMIPGVLRAYLQTNEILVSLMLNYVAGLAMYLLIYDSQSFWRDLTSPTALVFPQGKNLLPAATWPGIQLGSFTLPLGFVVATVLAVLLFMLVRATRFGFEMRVMADSPNAARYAGMRTKRTILAVMAISGALAGLGGASQIGDFGHVLDPRGLEQAQYGYTGIVVAALALYNPLAVVIVSIFIGALTNAGFALQGPSFPSGLVGTMEGIILFSVLGGEILGRYRLRFGREPRHVTPLDAAGAEADA
ncbi:MAG: ABC transporter permease [Chloroflexi bacterium]|nr:ABC transporter permease [Chloroflexota bacterium]